jgi:phenylacetate-CoA ligase
LKDLALQLYHRLPYFLKVVPASLYGYQLKRWRYGANPEELVAEALSREFWGLEKWQAWQEEKLAALLHHAATRVPYYREHWQTRRRTGDRASWEYLENWPILEKEPLRTNPRAFVAEDTNFRRMRVLHTSGTSGKPLTLWRSRATDQAYYALFEARNRRWHGVSRFDRWAMVGGKLVTPVWQRHPPFWVWNSGLNQLYMSSYHLAPDLIPYYLDALVRYRIKYLWGYTSALHALALETLRLKRQDLHLTVVLPNAEPVFDYQRQAIAEAFNCPVRENYGMTEIVVGAGECERGKLHLWPETGIVEVMEDCEPVATGAPGDLICTGLLNLEMPLIRYRTGDRGALSAGEKSCACGRTLPTLAALQGRADDVICTRDGRRVGRLDPVFKGSLPLREAQIIQESPSRLRVRYVPADGYKPAHGARIVAELQARLGPMEVALEEVAAVPRGPNGKFRAVICNIQA